MNNHLLHHTVRTFACLLIRVSLLLFLQNDSLTGRLKLGLEA